jgi:hypothetical protein
MNEQLVGLAQVLERQVELLDDGGAVVAGEGFVRLTNDVVHNVVGTFNGNLQKEIREDNIKDLASDILHSLRFSKHRYIINLINCREYICQKTILQFQIVLCGIRDKFSLITYFANNNP